jgi:hypothetical protein
LATTSIRSSMCRTIWGIFRTLAWVPWRVPEAVCETRSPVPGNVRMANISGDSVLDLLGSRSSTNPLNY